MITDSNMRTVILIILPGSFRFSRSQLILTGCSLLETLVAAILSILLMEPKGLLTLYACPIKKFSDWYTLFYNPTPNYEKLLHCSQEAVYPL